MDSQLEFMYGGEKVHCQRGDEGFWVVQFGEREPVKGPRIGPNDSPAVVEVSVRQLLPSRRDPAEPGAGLYRLAAGKPDEVEAEWFRAGRCYQGEPDEETRDDEGVAIVLSEPATVEGDTVTVHSSLLQRVEIEDCRELRKTGSSPWDL